jgi:hypothetical protein
MNPSTEPGCFDIDFEEGYDLDGPAEVALEDYARALTRARSAEARRKRDGSPSISGVHVCGAPEAPSSAAVTDVSDFARDLAARGEGAGLGWS